MEHLPTLCSPGSCWFGFAARTDPSERYVALAIVDVRTTAAVPLWYPVPCLQFHQGRLLLEWLNPTMALSLFTSLRPFLLLIFVSLHLEGSSLFLLTAIALLWLLLLLCLGWTRLTTVLRVELFLFSMLLRGALLFHPVLLLGLFSALLDQLLDLMLCCLLIFLLCRFVGARDQIGWGMPICWLVLDDLLNSVICSDLR